MLNKKRGMFCAIILLLGFYSIAYCRAYGCMCNSDWASETLIAKTLSEERHILSHNIYYNSEIRLLDEQFLQAILFLIKIGNWKINRLIANIVCILLLFLIMRKLLVSSLQMTDNKIVIGIFTALLMPISYIYADVVIWGGHYLWKLIIMLSLCIGYLHVRNSMDPLKLMGLCLLSLYAGVYGERLLIVIILPLVLADIYMSGIAGKLFIYPLLLSSGTGYFINRLLINRFHFADHNQLCFADLSEMSLGVRISRIADALLELFGYSSGARLFSVRGVANGFVILFLFCCIAVIMDELRHEKDETGKFYVFAAVASFLCNITVTLFLDMSISRYYIFNLVLFVPVGAMWLHARRKNYIFAVLIIIGFLLSASASTCIDILNCDNLYGHIIPNRYREQSIGFLRDHGYTYGFASYWNANIISEFTDGGIEVCGFYNVASMEHFRWNSLKKYDDEHYCDTEVFLLLSRQELDAVGKELEGLIVYEDDFFIIYTYPNSEAVWEAAK